MDDVAFEIVAPDVDEERVPPRIEVVRSEGAWTPGPFVCVIAGNEVEFNAAEFEWLIEVAGPIALARLREEQPDA